jgi:diaminohydroxyphosphoribosylaminopyrimidine deaminase/5-amino-6-(5-phosphoribosylamino)uracil reductase
MYVSLEPCAHQGKTPSCALRLVAERIKEVIICNKDPYEQVRGKGIEILGRNGIKITTGILENEGLWLNRRFFCFHQQQRPYIVLKWAQTEQGYFAPPDRTRHQMSNMHSLQLVHKWRTEEAAILVGTNTALNDNPQLTARLWSGRQPLRVVLDRCLRLPKTLSVFNESAFTWVINELQEKTDKHTRYVKFNFNDNVLHELLKELYQADILSLIVEGGAAVLDSFIKAGLWDEARVFVTPGLIDEGVAAPLLSNATKAFSSDIDSDTLHVYVNKQSQYQYINGMEL